MSTRQLVALMRQAPLRRRIQPLLGAFSLVNSKPDSMSGVHPALTRAAESAAQDASSGRAPPAVPVGAS